MSRRFLVAFGLSVLLLVALYLRVAMVLGTEIDVPLRADAGDYVTYATNLADHGVYSAERVSGVDAGQRTPTPDAFRNPGYPLFLTLFLRDGITIPRFVLDVTMVQALIGVGTVFLVFLLGRMLIGAPMALVPAALTAISPHQIAFTAHVLTETLFTALFVLFVLLLVRAVGKRERPAAGWIWVGVVLGASVLVRPTLLHLPLLLGAIVMIAMPWRKGGAALVCLLLGYALAAGPWFARNLLVVGQMTDDRLTIAALHHGSYPDFRFEGRAETQDFPYRADPESPRISASMDSVLAHIVDQFEQQPSSMLRWYLIGKPMAFFSWNVGQSDDPVMQYPAVHNPFAERWDLASLVPIMKALHWPLILFAALVVAASFVTRCAATSTCWTLPVRWIGALLLYAIAVHVVGVSFGRYSVPFMPLVYVLATVGVVHGARWVVGRRRPSPIALPQSPG
jgi:4-amino-4-deoxy-L-arabinose transferase-like glycosyltransferase